MDTYQAIELYGFTLFFILSIWTYLYNDKFFNSVHIKQVALQVFIKAINYSDR